MDETIKMFESVLVAIDRHRSGSEIRKNAISIAKTLRASLRVIYAIDFRDLIVFGWMPPSLGPPGMVLRGTPKEKCWTDQGFGEINEFAVPCEHAGIALSGNVRIEALEDLWAEEGRRCDLVMMRPAPTDFRWIERCFASIFSRVAARSGRPVLILSQDTFTADNMVLFYSNRTDSARCLPWVAALHAALELSLLIYPRKAFDRNFVCYNEFVPLLEHHGIPVNVQDGDAIDVLAGEAEQPGIQLSGNSLLVFDNGFQRGPLFCKRRRLLERIVRSMWYNIVLCP